MYGLMDGQTDGLLNYYLALALSTGVFENALRKAAGASEPLGAGKWVYPGVYPEEKNHLSILTGSGLERNTRIVDRGARKCASEGSRRL